MLILVSTNVSYILAFTYFSVTKINQAKINSFWKNFLYFTCLYGFIYCTFFPDFSTLYITNLTDIFARSKRLIFSPALSLALNQPAKYIPNIFMHISWKLVKPCYFLASFYVFFWSKCKKRDTRRQDRSSCVKVKDLDTVT